MKRWQKALLWSVAWIAFIIGVGIIHTEVVFAGQLTPAQDSAISERYGQICGVGLVGIWALFYLNKREAK